MDFWFKEHFVLFNCAMVYCEMSKLPLSPLVIVKNEPFHICVVCCRFVDFCRKFCGADLQFDEARVKAYYQKMDALKDLVVESGNKKQRTI